MKNNMNLKIKQAIWSKKLNLLGIYLSDKISGFVGTWTFVFIYTLSMILWMIFHKLGFLHIDSQDFIKWNLLLSYFAGTQASIVLMSSNRELNKDRQKFKESTEYDIKTLKMVEQNNKSIEMLTKQITCLENIIDDFLGEEK